MSKIHDNIEAIFGGSVTEEQIKEAFRLEHPGFTSHPMTEARNEAVYIHGDFNTATADCRNAGRFERLLYLTGGVRVAHHVHMYVVKEFRRQDLALQHLTKLVRFYDAARVAYVHLDAVDDGPIVWPQLGFELRERSDVELLHKNFRSIVAGLGYEVEPPAHAPALALVPEIEGVKVGLRALGQTYKELGERPIPMILDLSAKGTRAFLRERGILLSSS